ncbi:MAG: hypothetical protein M3O46_06070, partial [Myxococcota bacterium]|nr:hypothetical protein [Myxococcota bacterium]
AAGDEERERPKPNTCNANGMTMDTLFHDNLVEPCVSRVRNVAKNGRCLLARRSRGLTVP